MAKLVVDANVCVGCGHCTQVAPGVFELGADGKSHVKNEKGAPKTKIEQAIKECPVGAISWK